MGDRGNIAVEFDIGKKVYFYTHWNGSSLPFILKKALERGRPRWNDDSYFARILFCELIKDDVDGLTGYRISLDSAGDAEHPILVVSPDLGKIWFEDRPETKYTFEEFLRLPEQDLESL